MLALPIQVNRRRILVLILERENVTRMEFGDPVDLNTKDYFIESSGADPIELMLCYESDTAKLRELVNRGDLAETIRHLERGRTVYDGEIVKAKPWATSPTEKDKK